ncbi:hypothetical protein ACWGKW_18050 [Streptomyces sp. NPDC054766]
MTLRQPAAAEGSRSSPSRATQTTEVWGLPSGFTVASTAGFTSSRNLRAREIPGSSMRVTGGMHRRDAPAGCTGKKYLSAGSFPVPGWLIRDGRAQALRGPDPLEFPAADSRPLIYRPRIFGRGEPAMIPGSHGVPFPSTGQFPRRNLAL